MKHIYWIIDKLLGGRPGPLKAPWNPQALHTAGVRVVISLAHEIKVQDLSTYNLIHYRVNFPPLMPLSSVVKKGLIYQAIPVWTFIHQQITAGNPTVVHCREGKDRTGIILAGYLIIYRGFEMDHAIAEVRQANSVAMSAPGYADTLRILETGKLPDPKNLF